MNRPTPKTPLARLLQECELSCSELAEEVECSRDYLKGVSSGREKLSERIASKISLETGVGLAWLLGSDVTAPIVTPDGRAWTRAHARLRHRPPKRTKAEIEHQRQLLKLRHQAAAELATADHSLLLRRIYTGNAGDPQRTDQIRWRIGQFLKSLHAEFGAEPMSEADEAVLKKAKLRYERAMRKIDKEAFCPDRSDFKKRKWGVSLVHGGIEAQSQEPDAQILKRLRAKSA
jgi:hypothetical protein